MSDFSKEATRRSAKAGGITLNYYEAAPDVQPSAVGGGLPLVMLHGGGPGASAWSNFGPALPHFAAHFRTFLVDQPGFGGSDKPEVVGNYYRHAADHVVATPLYGHCVTVGDWRNRSSRTSCGGR